MDKPTERESQRALWLSEKQQETFRKDFQEKEREVQRYIGVYLSGLVLVTGWIIGPQSKPMLSVVLGNSGYNVYGLFVFVVLNIIFTSFLIYKSLIIHEITQFVAYLSPPDSKFNYWENWRRSPQSATRRTRAIYTLLLAVFPIGVSFAIMYGAGQLLYSDPQSLVNQLSAIESPVNAAQTAAGEATAAFVNPVSPEHLSKVFESARINYWIIAALHLIPLWFFFENAVPVNRQWRKINLINKWRSRELSVKSLSFNELTTVPQPTIPPQTVYDDLLQGKRSVEDIKLSLKPRLRPAFYLLIFAAVGFAFIRLITAQPVIVILTTMVSGILGMWFLTTYSGAKLVKKNLKQAESTEAGNPEKTSDVR